MGPGFHERLRARLSRHRRARARALRGPRCDAVRGGRGGRRSAPPCASGSGWTCRNDRREEGAPERITARANPLLIGHDEAGALLASFHRSGRCRMRWLISGPRGIGKATLAYRFARLLLAQAAGAAVSSGQPSRSPACRRPRRPRLPPRRRRRPSRPADARAHGQRQGQARATRSSSRHARASARSCGSRRPKGGWRIVVVDAADELNRNAANALLKVLEEPPRQALLLLVAHAPGRLLPTIRSRCRTAAAAQPAMTRSGRAAAALSAGHRAADEAGMLVRLAEGSIGRALELADAGGAELYGELVGAAGRAAAAATCRPCMRCAERLARAARPRLPRPSPTCSAGGWPHGARAAARARCRPRSLPARRAVRAPCSRAGLDRWVALWDKLAASVGAGRRPSTSTASRSC